ncbi:CZB domain-containing protein [Thermosulfurimonas sp. F29]|uniref:CZB domain-containing protein n=1 Tax=Thermosulfurimonas sp. F29 TaxID=2867247 RepID=UPI001C83BE5B|nr:CZB domain-containing protein [Thermosulfurimonas sp. F29]MBX6422524.1 CZB domain-containing protein [Thermosulfurimonas sp. F29]
MKNKPSSQLKHLRKALEKVVKEISELFEKEVSFEKRLKDRKDPSRMDSLYIELVILDFLQKKALLIKEALKCKDFSEHLELDPQKCAVGKFLSSFCPLTEVGRYLVEEIRGVHEKLHEEARRLAEEIRTRNPDCEDIRKILQERLFPLFNELLELLIDLSNHLEKGEPEN